MDLRRNFARGTHAPHHRPTRRGECRAQGRLRHANLPPWRMRPGSKLFATNVLSLPSPATSSVRHSLRGVQRANGHGTQPAARHTFHGSPLGPPRNVSPALQRIAPSRHESPDPLIRQDLPSLILTCNVSRTPPAGKGTVRNGRNRPPALRPRCQWANMPKGQHAKGPRCHALCPSLALAGISGP